MSLDQLHEYRSNKTLIYMLHHSVFYFDETSICLCQVVCGNIRYVKTCFQNSRQN